MTPKSAARTRVIMTVLILGCLNAQAGEQYPEYRRKLVANGWAPSPTIDADPCDDFAEWCSNRPEMHYCQSHGYVPKCSWVWERNGVTRTVYTYVDGDEIEQIIDHETIRN